VCNCDLNQISNTSEVAGHEEWGQSGVSHTAVAMWLWAYEGASQISRGLRCLSQWGLLFMTAFLIFAAAASCGCRCSAARMPLHPPHYSLTNKIPPEVVDA